MPPHTNSALGWKAFFACLALMQAIAIGVLWRTYDAVQSTSRLAELHDYQIREEIKPALRDLQAATRQAKVPQ